MIYEPKKLTLRDGRSAVLRSPTLEDAGAMLEYMRITAAETEFLLRYPEECPSSIERETAFLQSALESKSDLMLICEVDGDIAGNCHMTFMDGRIKTAHRASIAIAIKQKYWRLGIGSAMFEAMTAAAMEHEGTGMLELEVIDGNDRAIALYKKFGFEIVATRPAAMRLKDGRYLDEHIMIKRLPR